MNRTLTDEQVALVKWLTNHFGQFSAWQREHAAARLFQIQPSTARRIRTGYTYSYITAKEPSVFLKGAFFRALPEAATEAEALLALSASAPNTDSGEDA